MVHESYSYVYYSMGDKLWIRTRSSTYRICATQYIIPSRTIAIPLLLKLRSSMLLDQAVYILCTVAETGTVHGHPPNWNRTHSRCYIE